MDGYFSSSMDAYGLTIDSYAYSNIDGTAPLTYTYDFSDSIQTSLYYSGAVTRVFP